MIFSFTSKKSHHTGTTVPQENGASAMRETPTGTGGAIKGLKTWLAVSVTLVALLGVLGSGASSAFAESKCETCAPWWHLTAGSRPAYLQHTDGKPGVPGTPAEPEVQELSVTLEEYVLPEEAWIGVKVGTTGLGEFLTKALAEEEGYAPSHVLNAADLQKALEGPYGKEVQVSEEVIENGAGEKEKLVFHITTPAGVEPIGAFTNLGPTTIKVANPGKPEGPGIPAVPDGELYATAENIGDANAAGAGNGPVTFRDVLPKGLKAIEVAGTKPGEAGDFHQRRPIPCALSEEGGAQVATCTLSEALAPYDQIEMRIAVVVEAGAESEKQENEVSIAGGGAPPTAPIRRAVTISGAPVPFGVEDYEWGVEEAGGSPSVQAGKHPFQFTTTLDFNQLRDTNPFGDAGVDYRPEVTTPALAKDLRFVLPAGLIGNPTPIPQCTTAEFYQTRDGNENYCPPDTAVGVITVTIHEPATVGTVTTTEPIFNLEPRAGEPARFGFYVVISNTPVFIDTSLRNGADYGVNAEVNNVTQSVSFISSEATFWGVPNDARHDNQRGWGCLLGAREDTETLYPCAPAGEAHPPPFLVNPTQCETALGTVVRTDSWEDPGDFLEFPGRYTPAEALTGCNRLQFAPEVKVAADGPEASKPTGLTVDVHVPQEVNENAEGEASANVKDITVKFPQGVVLNPAAADGLQACPESLVGFQGGARGAQGEYLFSPFLPGSLAAVAAGDDEPLLQGVNFCSDASKIGTVTIKSPLLPKGQNVEGSLYLATPAPNGEGANNPFNSLIAMYIVAQDPKSGTLVKLPGSVSLDPTTGQITSTFENNPQLAFEDAEIHLFGGERAPLATPAHCGTYTTEATFTPWSGTGPVSSFSSFNVTSGPGGGACPPAALPFAPSLAAGTTSNSAGSFSPLSTTISREDGNQNIDKVQLHMPAGLSGILKGVPLCAEAQANAGTCSAASEIGKTVVSVGLGGDPFSVTGGEVFLTEKIAGSPQEDPFGLSIVNPAVAGPFNLGKVIVRATIAVDPHTAQLTVTTTEIPHILQGIPLQIKHVNVTIDRPGFTFNPTNCNPQQLTGTIGAVEGASAPVAVPFQVTNCAALKFAPKFSVSTKGANSKAHGATLTAKLSYPAAAQGTQSNITRVKVDLPKQLPSRLTTLQKACTSAQFEANPANCPKDSKIGYAKVTTPLLPVPLEGPAIFVSHGNEAFPSLTMVLQGYGITVDLVGTTFISSKGITSTTFKTVPDVPFNTFSLTLPQGKFSALAANVPTKAHYSLCGQTLAMPTEFLAQNGAKINESTKISVSGCAKKKAAKKGKKKNKSHKGGK
jgi:hypothetical protein